MLLFIAINVYLKFKNAAKFRVRSDGSVADSTDTTTRRTIVTHLQCLGLVQALSVSWPESVVSMFDLFNSVGSFDSHIASIECSSQESIQVAGGGEWAPVIVEAEHAQMLYAGAVLMFFLPLLVILLNWLYWVQLAPRFAIFRCKRNLRMETSSREMVVEEVVTSVPPTHPKEQGNRRTPPRTRLSTWQRSTNLKHENVFTPSPFDVFIMSTTLILYICYPSMARFLFRMLSCRESQGLRYLDADMLERCDVGRWSDYVGWVVIPSIILYVIGLPLAAVVYIWKVNGKQEEDAVEFRIMQFRVGLLFSGFHENRWWWELMVALRKILIIAIATFGKGDTLQVHYALGFLALFAALHIAADPFDSQQSSVLEILSLTTLCSLLWTAVFFVLEGQCDTDPAKLGWCSFLAFTAIAANVIFLMYAMMTFLKAWCHKHHFDEKLVKKFSSVRRRMDSKTAAPVSVANPFAGKEVEEEAPAIDFVVNYQGASAGTGENYPGMAPRPPVPLRTSKRVLTREIELEVVSSS